MKLIISNGKDRVIVSTPLWCGQAGPVYDKEKPARVVALRNPAERHAGPAQLRAMLNLHPASAD